MSDTGKLQPRSQVAGAVGDQFRAIADAMPQPAWIAAPDGSIEYFNQAWLDYTGVSVERMNDTGGSGVVHPNDLPGAWTRLADAAASYEPYEIEYRLRRARDSTYRWFLARAVPIRDEDGHIVHWIGTATDVDEQVRTNANLRFALDTASMLTTLLDVQSICDSLARIAVLRIADWCSITLIDEDGTERIASVAQCDTVQVDPLQSTSNDSTMTVLLSTDTGQRYGTITLASFESAHAFSEQDRAVVEMVAHRAAGAIRNATAYQDERRRSERMRFIARASELIFESFDLQSTFDQVSEFIVTEMADLAYVMLVEDGEALRTVSSAHHDPEKAEIANRMRGQRMLRPAAEDSAIRALAQGMVELHTAISVDEVLPVMWDYLVPDLKALKIHSAMTVPLHLRGETFGALVVYWCDSARAYYPRDVPVFEDLGRRLSIAIEHSRTLERERRIATSLQRALLPQPGALPRAAGLSFAAEYRPSSNEADVGGDWYDALTLPDGSIAVSVGDVTGRGLQSAGLMGKLRQAIAMASLYESDPARVLDSVDYNLRVRGLTAIATAFFGIISSDRKTLRYANAGHPSPLLRRGDSLIELRSDGLPLGLRDAARETTKTISIETADLLLLYTDGITKATRDVAFGERRLRAIGSSQAILYVRNPARFACDACLPLQVQDDTAVLTVRFGEGPLWSFDAENAQAAHDARTELMAYLRAHVASGSDLDAAELVFGEMVGNVVRHAPGPIDVQVDWKGEHPVLHVVDRGKGVVRNPALPDDPLSECGRGLYIISLLTNDLQVERIAGYGNHIAAELRLRRA